MSQSIDLYNAEQAGDFLGLSSKRVRVLANQDRLKGTRVGRDWIFRREDLEDFKKQPRIAGYPKGRPRKQMSARAQTKRG